MLYKYNIQNQGSEGMLIWARTGRLKRGGTILVKKINLRALGLSCFVDECEIGGTIMQKHH